LLRAAMIVLVVWSKQKINDGAAVLQAQVRPETESEAWLLAYCLSIDRGWDVSKSIE